MKNVGIVVDSTNQVNYKDLESLAASFGAELVTRDNMQGSEFEYAVIACDLS
jgi:hypothetical protein